MDEIDQCFLDAHKLEFIKTIASGGYGIIFKVHSIKYNQNFALKRIHASRFRQSEIGCMMMLDNSHILNLYDYYYYKSYVYMLLEYCPMSLQEIISQNPRLSTYDLVRYTKEILLAIKACHDNNVAHSDIKPSNFLIDNYGRIKACDFGLSIHIDNDSKSSIYKGSLVFMAPEIFNMEPYNPFHADIWSLGVTFFYMASQQIPYTPNKLFDFKRVIEGGMINAYIDDFDEYKELIEKCLVLEPSMRPNVDALLSLPIFKDHENTKFHKIRTLSQMMFQPIKYPRLPQRNSNNKSSSQIKLPRLTKIVDFPR